MSKDRSKVQPTNPDHDCKHWNGVGSTEIDCLHWMEDAEFRHFISADAGGLTADSQLSDSRSVA